MSNKLAFINRKTHIQKCNQIQSHIQNTDYVQWKNKKRISLWTNKGK